MTNPYQDASEEVQRQGDLPVRAAKTAGGALLGGAALKGASKVLPFLSKYIPSPLAIKGLTKADPRYGKFIQTALSEGTPMDEIKDFIREKAESATPKKNAQENRNIIEQYDPELHTYITKKLKEGMSLFQAGQKALGHGRFKKAVDKITKDHKSPWSAILQTVYGMGEQKEEQQEKTQQTQQQVTQQAPQQPQQESQPAQGGPIQNEIMKAIERAAASRQRRNAQ